MHCQGIDHTSRTVRVSEIDGRMTGVGYHGPVDERFEYKRKA